jgi:hypothetical protein
LAPYKKEYRQDRAKSQEKVTTFKKIYGIDLAKAFFIPD